MPADSLLDMARRACARYSARITDIGDLDYDLIRPVLLKIESPEKLHQLELSSPQIIGKDAEIWLSFIKRDIPNWDLKRHEPRDPKNWWKVYRKLRDEASRENTADEAALKAALASIKSEKEQNVTEIASWSRSDLPSLQPGRRARIQYNYVSGRAGSKGANKMTLMEKIRKEAKDARASKMNRPMHELQKRATAVTRAPEQFVEEVKKKKEVGAVKVLPPLRNASLVRTGMGGSSSNSTSTAMARPPMHVPRPPKMPAVDSSYDLTSDREARLRALKMGGHVAPSTTRPPSTTPQTNRSAADVYGNTYGGTPATLTANFLEDSDLNSDPEPESEPPSVKVKREVSIAEQQPQSRKRQREEDEDSVVTEPNRRQSQSWKRQRCEVDNDDSPAAAAANKDEESPSGKMLKVHHDSERPRSPSPMKLAPHPHAHAHTHTSIVRKKPAPSLFMTSPAKRLANASAGRERTGMRIS